MWHFAAAAAGAYLGYRGAKAANRETAASTAKQMAFQERMSNTAHQRQVNDLRAAGINPILSAKLGGASTPQGASYTAQNVGLATTQGFSNVAGGMQSIASARQSQAQTKQIQAQTKVTKQQEIKLKQEIVQMEDLHNERWQRLFATMGPENIATSVIAAINDVNIQTLLSQVGGNVGVNLKSDLEKMLEAVQAQKSILATNAAGFEKVVKDVFKPASMEDDYYALEAFKEMGIHKHNRWK